MVNKKSLKLQNTQLQQAIVHRNHMYQEEERLFQISLAAKEDANRRVREECTRITLEIERILDYNIVSYLLFLESYN